MKGFIEKIYLQEIEKVFTDHLKAIFRRAIELNLSVIEPLKEDKAYPGGSIGTEFGVWGLNGEDFLASGQALFGGTGEENTGEGGAGAETGGGVSYIGPYPINGDLPRYTPGPMMAPFVPTSPFLF